MKRVKPLFDNARSQELLLLLSEELKKSLIAISQLSELKDTQQAISAQAKRALRTIDNITLYQKIHTGQLSLKLEPVHVGNTIHTVANVMAPITRQSGCNVEVHIQHGLQPVDADRRLLEGALVSLWQAFITIVPNSSTILCRARKTSNGVRISLQANDELLQEVSLAAISMKSAQPIVNLAGSSTDLLTAQGLFALNGSTLSKVSQNDAASFGATLKVSRQLQMAV